MRKLRNISTILNSSLAGTLAVYLSYVRVITCYVRAWWK